MDAARLMALGPELSKYLSRFEDCFCRSEQREHLRRLVTGQLSDLPRKTLEPIALACGCPPRCLQQFLSTHTWDHDLMRDRLQQMVGREHAHPRSIGIFDETYHAKKGDKTPGTQRQWCGTKGATDNCAVTVHLAYAAGDLRCLIDSDLYLPQSWSDDRTRCREAGIPDEVVYRPKTRIALELLDRATANGVRMEWMTFDAGYGKDPGFLHELNRRGVRYVGEIFPAFHGWLRPPAVMQKEFVGRANYEGSGRKRKFPRLKVKNLRACSVEHLLTYSPALRDQPWMKVHIKDTNHGPMVWEVKHSVFYFKQEKAITFAHWLIVCRSPMTGEVKYFISNAPAGTPLEMLLSVAFERWRTEHCFRVEKSQLGLSHFEVRHHKSLIRHLIITSVTHLFLARVREKWACERGEQHAPDRGTAPHRDESGRAVSVDAREGAKTIP
jgi:SRSO17 transposase